LQFPRFFPKFTCWKPLYTEVYNTPFMKRTLLVIFSAAAVSGLAQTFTNTTGGSIPDNATQVCFPITVTGLPNQINTSTFGLISVCFNVTHTYDSDLRIELKAPDGTTITLVDQRGGSGDNFTNTCLQENATGGWVMNAAAPFTGSFYPEMSVNLCNNGQDPNGTWNLCFTDLAAADIGNLIDAALTFGNNPPPDPTSPTTCSDQTPSGCQCPDGTPYCDLLPDMTASALIIQQQHTEYPGYMTLSNATPNIGYGPMEIHGSGVCYCDTVLVPCSTTVCPSGNPPTEKLIQRIYHRNNTVMTYYDVLTPGTMSYHPSHGHIHVDNWAEFTLRVQTSNPDATTWPIIKRGSKISFCLINLGDCTNNYGYCVDSSGNILTMANIPNAPFGLVSGCGPDQGIYTGMLDIYDESLPGMDIDLAGVCNGNYYIVSITDPDNNFREISDNNNWAAAPVSLNGQNPPSSFTPAFTWTFSGTTFNFTVTSAPGNYIWDFGDGNTDTVNSMSTSHTYTQSGTYTVKLFSVDNCYNFSTQVIVIVTGSQEPLPSFSGFTAFPNPTSGEVRVNWQLNCSAQAHLELLSLVGETVWLKNMGEQPAGSYQLGLDLKEEGIAAGTYLLRLRTTGPSSGAGRAEVIRLIHIK
jgi:subtilisin-like proprotein convertase family protein/plastocyanin